MIQYKKNKNKINAWNIGPKNSNYLKVKDIVKIFFNKFYKETGKRIKIHFTKKNLYEKKYLFLNSSKLEIKLKIKNKFNINQTQKNTLYWYLKDIKKQADIKYCDGLMLIYDTTQKKLRIFYDRNGYMLDFHLRRYEKNDVFYKVL